MRRSLLIPGCAGLVLAFNGRWWGLALTVICVVVAWRRDNRTLYTPEAEAHRKAWYAAPKQWWTAPERGVYRVDGADGVVDVKLRRGGKLYIRSDGPPPARVT